MSNTVNQGAPGNQGPWPVTLVGSGGLPVVIEVVETLNTAGADAHFALTTAAATALVTADNSVRRNIAGFNNGPNPIFVGFDSVAATLTANGTPVPAGTGFHINDLAPTVIVYGIASVANQVSPADTRISETGGAVAGPTILYSGVATLPGGSPNDVVVAFAGVSGATKVLLSVQTPAGVPGIVSADPANYVNGVSFTIESSSPTDTSTVLFAVI